MNITFIGTGSAFNHVNGNNSAFLEFDGTNLLLDCGHDVPKNFEEKYGSIAKIDNIWISHMHGDHVGGLEEIAFKNRFLNGGKKVNLIVHESIYDDLVTYLEMTLKWDQKGLKTVNDYFNMHKITEQKLGYFEINDTGFSMVKVDHIGAQPAYYLTDDTFIFTGDAKFIPWDKYDLTNVEYIFQDTQLQKFGDDVHTTLPDLLNLPEEVRTKIWCMHYGQNINEFKKKIEDAGMHIVKQFDTIKI